MNARRSWQATIQCCASCSTRTRQSSVPCDTALPTRSWRRGWGSLLHRMMTSEVYYIVQGRGLMYIDDEEAEVWPGDTVYIPPGAAQYITNVGPDELVFLAIVEPAWRVEDEVVL